VANGLHKLQKTALFIRFVIKIYRNLKKMWLPNKITIITIIITNSLDI